MISTPDVVLQDAIKYALIESGCPINITDELMEKAHERHWPEGLSTLETRQLNRQHYESYVCRRIIGKQAVVVLSCDNRHMNQSMISEPANAVAIDGVE
jgi:E3 ubiquitin-protein ligase NRDP1